jgi:exonuclease III
MLALYWNIRGIANTPSRLALQRMINIHKPDLIFISEPKMNYNHFPPNWLHRLGYRIFSFNNRETLIPNLWCICSIHLNPIIIDSDDQQVSFSINLNNSNLYLSAIYASTSYLKRKDLWHKLSLLQSQFDAPWCYIGDFNVILGAHEHCGTLNPASPP